MNTCVKEQKPENLTHADYLRMQYEAVYGGYDRIPEYILRDLEQFEARGNDPAVFRPAVCGGDSGYDCGCGF